jgi:hypothetical protein
MVAILNQKWPPKYKNPPIWTKFGFQVDGHFEMAAILKILITKSTTLSDDLFLCQVSKGSAVRFELNIFCTLVTMVMVTIYFRNFQNGRRCHVNGQNAKKLKNTKMIIAGYSPNRN